MSDTASSDSAGPSARRQRSSARGDIKFLVAAYLTAELDSAVAVDAAGGSVLGADGRTVGTGRTEFDSQLGRAPQAGLGDCRPASADVGSAATARKRLERRYGTIGSAPTRGVKPIFNTSIY